MKVISTLCVVAALAVGVNHEAQAASAVAYCNATGAYAYCYNMRNVAEAKAVARRSCQRRGGTHVRILCSSGRKGYGAISFRRLPGRRIEAIGASAGAATKRRAYQLAQYSCNRVRRGRCGFPRVAWRDTVGTVSR